MGFNTYNNDYRDIRSRGAEKAKVIRWTAKQIMLRVYVKYRNNHLVISYNYGAQQINGEDDITNIGIKGKKSIC